MIKVLIVDDMTIFRECLKISLEKVEEIVVCGCAKNGKECIEYIKKCNPNLILLDINMPICNGIETIKKIRETDKLLKIIVLSGETDPKKIEKAILYGANLYLNKNTSFDNLLNNIFNYFENSLPYYDLSYRNCEYLGMTLREVDVYKLVKKGLTNQEISEILGISKGRVKNLVANLLSKTMTKNRVQLATIKIK